MALIRRPERGVRTWDPFRELGEMEKYFGNMFDWSHLPTLWSRMSTEGYWVPRVELIEKEDKYIFRAELPGLKKEDIDVSLKDNVLTISGERKMETKEEKEHYLYYEHYYGSFHRSIELPASVDSSKIDATYENGILEVTLLKTPEAKVKKIPVSTKEETK